MISNMQLFFYASTNLQLLLTHETFFSHNALSHQDSLQQMGQLFYIRQDHALTSMLVKKRESQIHAFILGMNI